MIKNLLIVGAGGMLGSMLRYITYLWSGNQSFPFATLAINIIGSFIIGIVTGYALKNSSFGDWRLFLATGICGGFTTFSAFSLECVQLLQQSRNIAALVYITCSLVFAVLAAFTGYIISR